MYLDEYTGRGVRVAVIDSGVHASHPHVLDPGGSGRPGGPGGRVVEGVAIRGDGALSDDFIDRLGHGTAVIAAIREKAPGADIIPIKIFWQRLVTDVTTLVRAIDEACARRASIINLSLGTGDGSGRSQLQAAVKRASDSGARVVSAASDGAVAWLPGGLEGVVPVELDWTCPREAYRLIQRGGRPIVAASGYPRDIPDVPRERNVKGISFAVANATGFIARAREALSDGGSEAVLALMAADAHCDGISKSACGTG